MLRPSPLFSISYFFKQKRHLTERYKLTWNTQPDAVFLHSNHKDVTYRIWQLLDTQKNELLNLLLSEKVDIEGHGDADGVICPLPFYPNQKNLIRIDPQEPTSETGIYRDLWERKPLSDGNGGDSRTGCVAYNQMDYTSRADYDRSRERGWARRIAIQERREARIQAEIEEEERAAASQEQTEPGKQKTSQQRS